MAGEAYRRYACANVSVDAREERVEGLILVLRSANPAGAPATTLSITSEPLMPGDTLDRHVDRKLQQVKGEAKDLNVGESRTFELRGRRAIELRFSWPTAFGAMRQTVVAVDGVGRWARSVTLFNLTRAVTPDDDATLRTFAEILETARFDDGEETTQPSEPPPRPSSSPPPSEPTLPLPQLPFVPMPGLDHRSGARAR